MPRGASPRRERQYRKLSQQFKEQGRCRGGEEEVASRIVDKQRSMSGETREEKRKYRNGESPDRGLPIPNYQQLTVSQVRRQLNELGPQQIRMIESYEKKHKNRKTLLEEIEKAKAV